MNDNLPYLVRRIVLFMARLFAFPFHTLSTLKNHLTIFNVALVPLVAFCITVIGAGITLPIIFLSHQSSQQTPHFVKSNGKDVLGAATIASPLKLSGTIVFNVPGEFDQDLTVNGTTTLNGDLVIKGKQLDLGDGTITASNIVYNLKAGNGLSVTGNQTPTITNTGVLSLQGSTGAVTLTAGDGIVISGTTISNTRSGSNSFATITDGTNSFSAGSTNDTLTFTAGSGITLTTDTTNKKITINAPSAAGLSGLTTNGVLYATSANTATTLTPGTAGFVLQSNGAGSPPSWVSNSATSPSFSVITTGTNTTAAMTVGTGASLTFSGSGTINANELNGQTTSLGGTLTTANSFTTSGANPLTLTTTGTTNVTLPTTGTLLTNTASANQTLTSTQNSGTVFGLTDSTNIAGALIGQAITLSGTGAFDQTGLKFNLSGASGSNLNDIVGSGSTWKVSTLGAATFASVATTSISGASITSSGSFLAANGSAGSPTYSFTNDMTTGLFLPASTQLGITTNGTERIRIDGSGDVGIGTSTPDGFFTVSGARAGKALAVLAATATDQNLLVASTSGSTVFALSNTGAITTGSWQATAIGPTFGGTGATSYIKGDTLFASAANTLSKLPIGSLNQVLSVNASGVPAWATVSGGTGGLCTDCVITDPTTSLTNTIAASASGVVSLTLKGTSDASADIFDVKNNAGSTTYFAINASGNITSGTWNATAVGAQYGGTGQTGYTTGDILYASNATTLTKLPIGSANQVLSVSAGVPAWASVSVSGGAGGGCTNCLINNPTTSTTNTVSPSGATVALTLQETSGVASDILRIQNAGGTTTYMKVDSNGNLTVNGIEYFANGTTYFVDNSGNANFLHLTSSSLDTSAVKSGLFNGNVISTGSGTLTLGAGKTLTANASLTLTGTDSKTLTLSDSTTFGTNSITFAGAQVLALTATKNVTFADAFTTSGAFPLTLTTTGSTNITLPTTGTLLTNTQSANQTITSTQNSGTVLSLADATNLGGAIKGLDITLSGTGAQNQTGLQFNLSGASGTNLYDVLGSGSTWKITTSGDASFNTVTANNITPGGGGGGSGTIGFLQRNNGALSPTNLTDDFLTGATSTASANVKLAGPSGTNSFIASGNVGIGTRSPSTTLEVAGDERIYNSTNQYGSLYSNSNLLDKTWNSSPTFSATGTTFSGTATQGAQLTLASTLPLSGWVYRVPMTVTNNTAGALTNYQVSITMDTATPIAAGKMNSDCSDLRPTDSDGVTVLSYWIESGCNTTTTKVWVKVPSIPGSGTDTVYMNYGNPAATSLSSTSNTFIRTISNVQAAWTFDEGAGVNSTDQSGDGNTAVATGTTSVAGKFGNAKSFNGTTDLMDVANNATLNNTTGTFAIWVKTTNTGNNNSFMFKADTFQSHNGVYMFTGVTSGFATGVANTTSVGNTAPAVTDGNWHFVVWTFQAGGNATLYVDGSSIGTPTAVSAFTMSANDLRFARAEDGFWGTFSGQLDNPRVYNKVLSAAEVTDLNSNFGYVTPSLPNTELVRKYTTPEPSASAGAEQGQYLTGLQSWTSETQDAGVNKTFQPNYLTVNYTLDGSDNIHPKFQVLGSDTGAFTGEETIYPAGTGTFYQNGGTYSITPGVQKAIFNEVTTAHRYWRVKAYMDTGATVTDTPKITSIRLQDYKPLILNTSGQYVGIGTTTPTVPLDVNGNINALGFTSPYATLSASLNVGYSSVLGGVGNAVFSGNVGIGTNNPQAFLDVNSFFDVFSTGKIGIGTLSPLATLDLRGNSGTTPAASISAQSSFAGLVVDNKGVGDLFTASSSGLTRFVITQNGNVGIGTSTPSSLDALHAVVSVNAANGAIVENTNAGSSAYGYIQLGNNSNHSAGLLRPSSTNTAYAGASSLNLYTLNADPIGLVTGNALRMFISGTGNVGIGSNNPASLLHVEGAGSVGGVGTAFLTLKNTHGFANDLFGIQFTNTGFSGSSRINGILDSGGATAGLQFFTGGATPTMRLAIDGATGSVGIGTSSMLAALDVRGTSGTTPIASFSAKTSFAGMVIDNSGVGDLLTASTSGTTRFVINNQGNVGIGKAVPTVALDVVGSESLTGNLNIGGYATTSASLAVGYSNALAGIGNAVFSGSVGVGTSSPTEKLSIAGNLSVYNSTTGRGDIFSTSNLDKIWNTTALFNSAGATFSASMKNPASNNRLSIASTLGLTGWDYRQPVTINNTGNSNTLTNYQASMSANTSALIAAGKMNSDCSDIRITDTDGSTTLGYWIESGCNTTNTVIWTKVPSIAASSNKTIYMYYGNSNATSLSSVTNVFIRDVSNVALAYRLDETSGSSVTDYSGNNNTGTATGTTIIAGQFNNGRSTSGTVAILPTSNVSIATSWSVSVWANFPLAATGAGWRSFFNNAGSVFHHVIVDVSNNLGVYNNAFFSSGYNVGSLTGWHNLIAVGNGGTTSFYIDGTVVGTASAEIQNTAINDIGNFNTQQQSAGKLDEVRIYTAALTQAQISDVATNYGYVTTNDAGHELVRKFSAPEPSTSLGAETTSYNSGLQSWTSDTIDAGANNTIQPNLLTVSYTLDGSDNIHPKFQLLGANASDFSDEQIFPGNSSFYQNGTSNSITSGIPADISGSVPVKRRYWKVVAYMDTGATTTDTPTITSIRLQDYRGLSLLAGGLLGINNTAPSAQLDVGGSASLSSNLIFRGTAPNIGVLNGAPITFQTSVGGDTALTSKMTILNNGNVGIGTRSPSTTLEVAGDERVFNSTNQYGSLYTSTGSIIDKSWNSTTTFNASGTTFSAGMTSPAVNNHLTLSDTHSPKFLPDWNYRQPVTVNNTTNGNTLTNYQASISANTSTLIAASKMNADCSDLRITDTDGITTLPYWIEGGCNTTNTVIWTKVPSIAASSNKTIYLYYGNSGATSASSSSTTFVDTISGVQSAWKFDEASGTTASDSSGNGDTGTATGTTVVAGKFNNARTFANTDKVVAGTGLSNITSQVTLSAWVKPTSFTDFAVIIAKSAGVTPFGGWQLDERASGAFELSVNVNGAWTTVTSSTHATGSYYYVVGTYDGTNLKIYINGTLEGTVAAAGSISYSNPTTPIWIGQNEVTAATFIGTIDEPHIYSNALTSTQITELYGSGGGDYGYVTTNSPNTEYVKVFSAPEPVTTLGAETAVSYTSGLQSWSSDTVDAGAGKTLQPNFLTVNYTLDGSDNIHPKFQVLGSDTGAFAGEETIYPNGTGTFYQNGGTYSITSGTVKNISTEVTTAHRYWKIKAYMDTGATLTDTPKITNMRLQDTKPLVLNGGGQYVGIGTTTPTVPLDVNGNINTLGLTSTYATLSASLNVGYASVLGGIGNAVFSGNVGIGTNNPQAFLDVNSLFDVFSSGKVSIGTLSPLATFDLRGNSGTTPAASISAQTAFAGLVVDNKGVGDLFTASSSGLNRFVITQGGNVGIGNTSPSRALDIAANVVHSASGLTSQLSLRGTANSTNKLNVGYDTTSNYGFIEATNENVAWQNLALQPSGGNVGIGTSTPNASLDFGTVQGTNKIYLLNSASNDYGLGINTVGGAGALQLYAGAASVNNFIQFGRFDGTSITEMARIQNSGLGLGTTSLLSTLDVRGNSGTTSIASVSGKTSFATMVVDNSGVGDLFTASTSGTTKFIINSQGNVGIGKAVPTVALDVVGSGAFTSNVTASGNLNVGGYATASASLAVGYSNSLAGVGNAIFSGQVGIGTSSPTEQLSIAGNMTIYNSTTARGDIFATAKLDHTWNTTALFNSAGATFSAGMNNPATNNKLSIASNLGLSGWTYRQPVTVNNTTNGNTLTNYQASISANTSTLIAAGKMNADCSDIRITDTDGATTLGYWIESGCNTTNTVIWTKVPSIAASSNKTIYLYYGNPNATSLSSVTNVFIRDIASVALAYKFDEASGNTTDFSGNNNTGTPTSATVVAGQFNSGRSFNGSTSKIVAADSTSLSITGHWSTFAWINTTNSALTQSIIEKFDGGGANGYILRLVSGKVTCITLNGAGFDTATGATTVTSGVWHHVGCVYNGTTLVPYLDGTADGTLSTTRTPTDGTNSLLIGQRGDNTNAAVFSGTIDEPRVYSIDLSAAQITDLAANYGYVTTNDAGHELVRKFSAPDPVTTLGAEATSYTSGLQSWTSDTLDAGAGSTFMPNLLTVTYTLDGSDNIHPKFQVLGANTSNFTDEVVYPGNTSYYQNGTSNSITSGVPKDVTGTVPNAYRYWKVVAYMDTGATTTDTPIITNIRLQDYRGLSLLAGGLLGINNTAPSAQLDVGGSASLSSNLIFRGTAPNIGVLNGAPITFQTSVGGDTALTSKMTILNNGNVGIGTTNPDRMLTIDAGSGGWDNTLGGMLKLTSSSVVGPGITLNNTDVGGAVHGRQYSIVSVGHSATAASGSLAITDMTAGNLDRFVIDPNGRVGINVEAPNFKLDVADTQAATVAAMITNSNVGVNAAGLAIKLANTTPATTNYFETFLNGNGEIIGKIAGNGANGVSFSSTGIDFAEYYKKQDASESAQPGDVMCLDVNGVTKCQGSSSNIIGVVSHTASFVGGGNHDTDPGYVLVGLIGQLKVKVATTSGEILRGDPLTASAIPGVAVKATTPGAILGHAMTSSSESTDGTVMLALQISWYDANFSTVASSSSVGASANESLLTSDLPLSVSTATVSGSLTVLGRTTLSDLGVTGDITAGVISIHGMDGQIDNLGGDLQLQSQGLGGVNILAGKVVISTAGNMTVQGTITAQEVTTDKLNITTGQSGSTGVLGASAGSVTISQNQMSVTISTNKLTPNSLIFITPDIPVSIAAKKTGDQTFQIMLSSPAPSPIHVNWWIVN